MAQKVFVLVDVKSDEPVIAVFGNQQGAEAWRDQRMLEMIKAERTAAQTTVDYFMTYWLIFESEYNPNMGPYSSFEDD